MRKTNKAYIYKQALLNVQNTLIADIQARKEIRGTINKVFDIIADALKPRKEEE